MKKSVNINIIPLLLIILGLSGACSEPRNNGKTVLTGKILHPQQKYMLLYNTYLPGKNTDTAYIDSTGNFLFVIHPEKGGLYVVANDNEMGYVYLKPGDSVDVFTDARNMDATIAFSGDDKDFNELQKRLYLLDAANQQDFIHMLIRNDLGYKNYRFFLKKITAGKEEILADAGEHLQAYRKDSVKNSILYVMSNAFPLYLTEVYNAYHPGTDPAYHPDSVKFDWSRKYPSYVILPMFASFYFTNRYLPGRTFTPDSVAYLFDNINRHIADKDLADMTKVFVMVNMLWKNLGKNRLEKLNKIYDLIEKSFYAPQYLNFTVKAFEEMSKAIEGGLFATDSLWSLQGKRFSAGDWEKVKGVRVFFIVDSTALKNKVYDSIFSDRELLDRSYFVHMSTPGKDFLFRLLTDKKLGSFKERNFIYRYVNKNRFKPYKSGFIYVVDENKRILKMFTSGNEKSIKKLQSYLDSSGGK